VVTVRASAAAIILCLAAAAAACNRSPAPSTDGAARPTIPAAKDSPTIAPVAPPPSPIALDGGAGEIAGVAFQELVTGGGEANERLPLLVAIHGLGDRPESFLLLFRSLDAKARVVAPRGLDPHGGGYSWFPTRVATSEPTQFAAGMDRAASRLADAIKALASGRPTLGKPIVTGFSQGGMLTFVLSTKYPEVVGAAFPLSGWLPQPLWPASRDPARTYPRIFATHGDADDVLRIGPTREGVEHLAKLGFDVTLREYPGVGHTVSPAMRADLARELRAAVARVSDSR
jgi:phospholipase/carboxylesterase